MRWSLSLRLGLDWDWFWSWEILIYFYVLAWTISWRRPVFFLFFLARTRTYRLARVRLTTEAYLVWKTAVELNWRCGWHNTTVLNCCSSTEFVCIFHAQDWAHIYDFIFYFMHALDDWKYFHSLYCNQALQLIWLASCNKNTKLLALLLESLYDPAIR